MKKNKTKVTEWMLEILMKKYESEISRMRRLEDKGYKYSLLIFLFIGFYILIKCLIPMSEPKCGYFIINLILTLIYVFSFTVSITSSYLIYGLKTREEADILSQWDVLISDPYDSFTESIRYGMLDVIKKLENQNDKLADNIKVLITVNTIVGIATFSFCMWRLPW